MSFFENEIKKLGFGLMRLPQKDGVIDIEQVKIMVDKFNVDNAVLLRQAHQAEAERFDLIFKE